MKLCIHLWVCRDKSWLLIIKISWSSFSIMHWRQERQETNISGIIYLQKLSNAFSVGLYNSLMNQAYYFYFTAEEIETHKQFSFFLFFFHLFLLVGG